MVNNAYFIVLVFFLPYTSSAAVLSDVCCGCLLHFKLAFGSFGWIKNSTKGEFS